MELVQLFSLLKGAPAEFVTAVALAAIIIGLVLRLRKTDVEGFTSISKMQQDNLVTLMEQNKQLGTEITGLRQEIAEQHKIIQALRKQVDELERDIREYRKKCDTCPGPGGEPPATGVLITRKEI